ncbi:hypothetical protein BGZ72_008203 [Mortierella alpina]|nr:hypothetical protein BGZ72_008203 [Mortierella alpina]
MSSATFIFQIPELAACIARYLTPADVTNAMATCKAWSKLMQPFFWTNFCPKDKLPELSVLAQNLHHIRTIDLNGQLTRAINFEALMETLTQGLPTTSPSPSAEDDSNPGPDQFTDPSIPRCTNLRRIKISYECYEMEVDDPIVWFLMSLLHYNRDNLTHLELQLDGIDDMVLTPIVLVFSQMVCLQHLTLRTSFQTELWFMLFLRACLPLPRLSELYCHFFLGAGKFSPSGDTEVDYRDRDYDSIANPTPRLKEILDTAIAARTSFDGSIDVKIKALRFPDPEEDDIDLIRLVLPILRSDLVEIETLEVPRFLDNRPEKLYAKIVREHCPALRHLIIPPYDNDTDMAKYFIRAATGLKTVQGFRLSDEAGWLSRNMIRTLVKHHAKTLEEVELMICRMIRGRDQQELFASCKQLKRFWMVPDGWSEGAHGIEFRDIITGPWSCLGMRELSLTLNRSIDVKAILQAMREESLNKDAGDGEPEKDEPYRAGDKEQKRKATAWAAKQAFAQIGRLTALEHLALGTDEGPNGTDEERLESEWDLTLSEGWLAQLAGLKNLRHFHMRTNHWSKMGQAEVEFMDAEWPLLDCVTFDRCSMTIPQFHKEIDLPHWKWLQQKRPSLRLSAIHMYSG